MILRTAQDLRDGLASPDAALRLAVLRLMTAEPDLPERWLDEEEFVALVTREPHPQVREAAVQAVPRSCLVRVFAELADPPTLAQVAARLGPDRGLAVFLREGGWRGRVAATLLEGVADLAPEEELARDLALGRPPGVSAPPAWAAVLRGPYAAVARRAVEVSGRFDTVAAAWDDLDPASRRWLLAAAPEPERSRLLRSADLSDPALARLAARFLPGGDLAPLLEHADPATRAAAVARSDRRDWSAMLDREEHPAVRAALVRRLAEDGPPLEDLLALLDDHWAVRSEAIRALRQRREECRDLLERGEGLPLRVARTAILED